MLNTETLQEILERYGPNGANQHVYVLADHSGLPGLARTLKNAGAEWTSIFGNDKRPELITASPLLFELTENSRLSRWLAEATNFSHCILLIASPLDMDVLTKRLALRCEGTLSDNVAITVRFFDTRVFPELLNVLTEEVRKAWLGCATNWWYQARDGEIVGVSSDFIRDERLPSPLALTDQQMHTLLEASEPDQVADLLAQYTPHQFNAIPESQRYTFVQDMIRCASDIGISSSINYAIYSGLMLMKGTDFERSPEWSILRKQIANGDLTLFKAIELLGQKEEQ